MCKALKILLVAILFIPSVARAESSVYQRALRLTSEEKIKIVFDVFYSAGDWDNAYLVAKAGAKKFPKDIFWWDKLIDISLWTNRVKEAYEYFDKLWQLARDNSSLSKRLFHLAHTLKRYDVMVRLIESGAIPKEKVPLKQLILVYRKTGRPFVLMKMLERYYRKKKSAYLRKELVLLYMQYDRPERAFSLLRSLSEKKLSYKETAILAYLYSLKGKRDYALKLLLSFKKEKGNDPAFIRSIADLALSTGRYELAANYLQKLPKLSKTQRNFLFQYYFYIKHNLKYAQKYTSDVRLALSLFRTKQWKALIDLFSKKPKKDILRNKELRNSYLIALLKIQRLNEARKLLEYAYKKGWAGLNELDLLAYINEREGRWKEVYRISHAILKTLSSKKELTLQEKRFKAHSLQNLQTFRSVCKARKVYEELVDTKRPEFILDYLDPDILETRKWDKWLKMLNEAPSVSESPDLRSLYEAKYAYWLSWKGDYNQAFDLAKRHETDPTSTSDIARYEFFSGKRKEAVSFLERYLKDNLHTGYEKRLLRWQIVDMEDLYLNRIEAGISYWNSSSFGWCRKEVINSRLYFNDNLLEAEFDNLLSKPELYYNSQPYYYTQRENLLKIGWNLLRGSDYLFDGNLYLLKAGDIGASFDLQDLTGDLTARVSLFFNRPEENITPLSYFWALKRGISSEITFKYRPRVLLGLKSGWCDFNTPSFMPIVKEKEDIGNYANFEPYIIFLNRRGNELSWQYGLGTLFLIGSENGRFTSLIPERFIMPSVTFAGNYLFGKWPHKLSWILTLGYLFSRTGGITTQGRDATGRVELEWPLGRLNILKCYIERGVDIQHGGGQVTTGLYFQKRF